MQGVGEVTRAVLLHEPSLFCLVAGAGAIRRADVIYLGRRVPLADPSPQQIARVRRWVGRLNPVATVVELPLEAVTRHLWRLNEESVDMARAWAPRIQASRVYAVIRDLVRDDVVVKYFQAALVRRMPNGPLLDAMAQDLKQSHADVTAVPAWDVPSNTSGGWMRAARWVMSWKSATVAALMPKAYALRRLRFGVRRGVGAKVRVAVPVVWGLRSQTAATEGRRPQEDRYLYGAAFGAGDIVHVFSDWRLPAALDAETREACAREGLPCVDRERAGFDLGMATVWMRSVWAGLRLLAPFRHTDIDRVLLPEAPKAIYTFLKKHAECRLAPADVVVVKDDYNPGHVIGTIVCHTLGARTLGVQHVGAKCDAPQLAFVHVDRHAVYAPMLAEAFGREWPAAMVAPVGRESIDWVIEAAGSAGARAALRARWQARHAGAGPRVLVLFPGPREICLARQWDEMFAGLSAFAATASTCTIILRFRSAESMQHPLIARFAALPDQDPRFVVEMTSFTTYELLAVSDFVIAPEASFTINEAAAIGVPVVTFEYVGTATRYFGRYGRQMVLRTADDVATTLSTVAHGGLPTECDWPRLSAEANYFTDGHNRERLQQAARALLPLSA